MLDDARVLLLFGVGMAVVITLNGSVGDIGLITPVLREPCGAILPGMTIGLSTAYLDGRNNPDKPVLPEALGIAFLCSGLANRLGVSYLIASIVTRAVIANRARHHVYPFHAIQGIESLFMVVSLVLAGESLEFPAAALLASTRFPQFHQVMPPIVISSSAVFEIVGTVFTRFVMQRDIDQQG